MGLQGRDPLAAAPVNPYFSRLEADWLRTAPEQHHRRMTGSLMSADLSGFTALSERLAAQGREGSERLTAMVNACFTAIISASRSEGGDVLKFGGDALLIWFEGDGHEVRAATAGARMQRAIGAARFTRAGLRMSVGVHTGGFDAFLVGPDDWRELILAGREVSATVALESAAEAGEVMVSPELAQRLAPGLIGVRRGPGYLLALPSVPLPRRPPPEETGSLDESTLSARFRSDVDALGGLGGEHRLATVVFAELEGTDLSVAADQAAMAESLDSLVHATLEKAEKYRLRFLYTDVIVDGIKFICTAGAPTSTGEDEEAGLRMATDLIDGDPLHKLRAGVHRGRVFAGFLGSEARRTYTVMGDPVNLAARLMSRAEPSQVVASDEVVRRSRATFRLTPLAPFLVKGRQAPVTAHVVGGPTGERRGQLLSALPLVGRDAELAVLEQGIGAAADGAGAVVEVTGDAGIGKTRLLEAVADDPRVVVRIATECQPYDGLSPYSSARTLLRRALGIPGRSTSARAGEQLLSTTRRIAPDLLPMLPLAAVVLGAEVAPTPEADAVAEQFRTEQIHATVVALLAAALPQTTLLVVEDIYYADDASLQLFRAIAAGVAERPWLMTITRRPEGPGLVADGVDGTVLKLGALPDAEASRLAELAAGGGAALHPLEHEEVARRAGGNPLFLLQLLSSTQSGTSADELPESIERVIATRIDRLAPADRALLRQAAVVGRVFHPAVIDALRAAAGNEPVNDEGWDGLSDLVEPAGQSRWRFRHALFRDVAYEGLPFARRRRMHAAVGELLEAGMAGEPDAALLSEHFWLSGDAERTWHYSIAAGDQAWAASATTEAIAAYERALGVRRRLRDVSPVELAAVAENLGDVLERAARYAEAERAYRAARWWVGPAGSTITPVRPRLARKLGVLCERTGRYGASARWYRTALAQAREQHPAERAEIELCLAGLSLRRGRPHELVTWATRAIESARTARAPRPRAHAQMLMVAAATFDDSIDADTHAEAALRHFEAEGDQLRRGKVLNNLGILVYFKGDWVTAADHYIAAAAAFRAAGDIVEAASATNNLAEILSDQGHLDTAKDHFTRVLSSWAKADYAIGIAVATSNLGRTLTRAGHFDRGRQLLEEARERFELLGATIYALDTSVRVAEAAVLAGDADRALSLLDEVAQSPGASFPAVRVAGIRTRGWALASLDRRDEAQRLLFDASREANASGIPFEEVLTLRGLEQLARLSGDAKADAYQAEADGLASRLGIVALPSVPLPLDLTGPA